MDLYTQLCVSNLLNTCWEHIYSSKNPDIRRISRGIDDYSIEDFKKNESLLLSRMLTDLRSQSFTFSPLKGTFISKATKGKYRLLTVPTVRDRVLHRALLSIITPIVYPYIKTDVSYCGVAPILAKSNKGKKEQNLRKAVDKIICHLRQRRFWIFESDIKGFFDYVDKGLLLEKLSSVISSPELIHLLKQIVYFTLGNRKKLIRNKKSHGVNFPNNDTGISQGSSLSPIFSNIYLADFDRKMKALCEDRIIRYVDDFIIMGETENEVRDLGEHAITFMRNERLELQIEKTHTTNLKVSSVKFLGLKFDRNQITLKKTREEILQKFNEDYLNFDNYKSNVNGKRKLKIDQINERILGWANCYRYYHVDAIYRDVKELLQRYRRSDSKYEKLNLLDKVKLEPIISKEEWISLFQSHKKAKKLLK